MPAKKTAKPFSDRKWVCKQVFILVVMLVSLVLLPACHRSYFRDGMVNNHYLLQSSDLYIAPYACLQNLTIRKKSGEVRHYRLIYDATSDKHVMVLLGVVGQRMLTVTQIDSQLYIEKSLPLEPEFPASELFTAMQLIYWPLKQLTTGLEKTEWRILDENDTRLVYKKDDMIVKIRYSGVHDCTGSVEYTLGGDKLVIDGTLF